jgi:Protein of unknown function (DUF2510)
VKRTEKPQLRRSSMVRQILLLVLAWLWAGAVIAVCFGYHLTQANSPFLVANGHTYYTHRPALTLSQQDPVSAKIITVALAFTILTGTIDLLVRLARRMTGPGIASITVGGALILFSLGGLLWGLLGIGGTGLLVVLSGLAMKPRAVGPADTAPAIEVSAARYPDPTERHDLRYWDHGAWSSQVATAGQVSIDPL